MDALREALERSARTQHVQNIVMIVLTTFIALLTVVLVAQTWW